MNFPFQAELIKKSRIKKNLTQQEVSDNLGYSSAQFVSNWERGLSEPPDHSVRLVCRMLKISKDDLTDARTKDRHRHANKEMANLLKGWR